MSFSNCSGFPKNPVISSAPSRIAVSIFDSPFSIPPPKSENPFALSSLSFSFPKRKYNLPLCSDTGNTLEPVIDIQYSYIYILRCLNKTHIYSTVYCTVQYGLL